MSGRQLLSASLRSVCASRSLCSPSIVGTSTILYNKQATDMPAAQIRCPRAPVQHQKLSSPFQNSLRLHSATWWFWWPSGPSPSSSPSPSVATAVDWVVNFYFWGKNAENPSGPRLTSFCFSVFIFQKSPCLLARFLHSISWYLSHQAWRPPWAIVRAGG